jgi:thiamine kinase-like enzyme
MNRIEAVPEEALPFLKQQGICPERQERIQMGRNSRVWLIESGGTRWILKEYFRHPQDPRNRLHSESAFISFLNRFHLPVPQVVSVDHRNSLGLYTWLEGVPVTQITEEHIAQCSTFIEKINEVHMNNGAKDLPPASEACIKNQLHWEYVQQRMQQLKKIEPVSALHQEVLDWINMALQPKLEKVLSQMNDTEEETEELFNHFEPILSPSDFGFHNILEYQGQLHFFDFEYAGWDDPAKLCADFACQPEYPVSEEHAKLFCQRLGEGLEQPDLPHRFNLLIPLYRIKWCCIMLNEFRKQDRERREHAASLEPTFHLNQQFSKAQNYFSNYFS